MIFDGGQKQRNRGCPTLSVVARTTCELGSLNLWGSAFSTWALQTWQRCFLHPRDIPVQRSPEFSKGQGGASKICEECTVEISIVHEMTAHYLCNIKHAISTTCNIKNHQYQIVDLCGNQHRRGQKLCIMRSMHAIQASKIQNFKCIGFLCSDLIEYANVKAR